MDRRGALEVGDPCFAKVKGWIPYPARITAIKNSGKKLKFKVLFYETNETNEVASDCVWPVTPDTVKKLVTSKTLKRKYFLPAFDQLRKFHKIEIPFKDDSEQEIGSDKGVDKEIAKCPFGEESDAEQEIESDKGVEKEIAKCTIGEESQPNEIVDLLPEHLSSDDEFDLDFYNLKMTVKNLRYPPLDRERLNMGERGTALEVQLRLKMMEMNMLLGKVIPQQFLRSLGPVMTVV